MSVRAWMEAPAQAIETLAVVVIVVVIAVATAHYLLGYLTRRANDPETARGHPWSRTTSSVPGWPYERPRGEPETDW